MTKIDTSDYISTMRETRLDPVSYQIFRALEGQQDLLGDRWLIACSGGMDSVALWQVARDLQKRFNVQIGMIHVHHGPGDNIEFRDQALAVARAAALEDASSMATQTSSSQGADSREVHPFFQINLESNAKSEAELRAARIDAFAKIYQEWGATSLWLGHHRQDQLETRLINLIRGTGPDGLRGMKPVSTLRKMRLVRPLLGLDRPILLQFAERRQLRWVDDPTNSQSQYLRNWIRGSWLGALESRHPGGVEALTRSLEVVAQQISIWDHSTREKLSRIPRNEFNNFDVLNKCEQLRALLRDSNAPSYSQNQLLEVIKRLDSPRKVLSFTVGQVIWEANPDSIRVKLAKSPLD